MDERRGDAIDELEDLERREEEAWRELLGTATWDGDRWHVEGKPVHAGDELEVLGVEQNPADPDTPIRAWFKVRVESENRGGSLVAHLRHYGLIFRLRLTAIRRDPVVFHPLRWPR